MYITNYLIIFNIIYMTLAKLVCVPDETYSKCEGYQNLYDHADMNLDLVPIDDTKFILNGTMLLKSQFDPARNLEAEVKTFRIEGGRWRPSALQLYYPDFCSIEFSESKPWYFATRDFKGNARKCPPPPHSLFEFNEIEFSYDMEKIPIKIPLGYYRVQLFLRQNLILRNKKIELCLEFRATVQEE